MTESSRAPSGSNVAYRALAMAELNANDIKNHEDICAERYGNISKTMAEMERRTDIGFSEIKSLLKWAGGALFAVIISLLGFLATQQFNSNDAARKQAEAKIALLERQLLPAPAAGSTP